MRRFTPALNLLRQKPRRLFELFIQDPAKLGRYLLRLLQPPDPRYRILAKMTLADWMQYHNDNLLFKRVTWMGVTTVKNVLDAWIYQEIQ